MNILDIKSGRFLTRERIRIYSLMCIILTIIGLLWHITTVDNLLLPDGQPLGTDFSNVYAAGTMVNDGQASDVWDWPKHFAAQTAEFGDKLTGYYGWQYPPMFLFIAALLAFLPYVWALITWQISTLAFFIYSLRKITHHIPGWYFPVLGFPAIFINLTNGHNGFMSASLFGLGLYFLRRRPVLAGIFIGLLAYKPHFGFLIPLALLAGQYYRTFFSAAITVMITAALSTLAYGIDIWPAFIESFSLSREIVLEEGNTGWYKIQSAFSAIMNWTGSLTLAYSVQALLVLFVTITIFLAFRRKIADEDKYALLLIGSLLFTPYLLDYDLVILAPAIAFLAVRGVRDGFRSYEVFMLLFVWFMPLIARTFMLSTTIPVAVLSMLMLFIMTAKPVYTKRPETINIYNPYRPA